MDGADGWQKRERKCGMIARCELKKMYWFKQRLNGLCDEDLRNFYAAVVFPYAGACRSQMCLLASLIEDISVRTQSHAHTHAYYVEWRPTMKIPHPHHRTRNIRTFAFLSIFAWLFLYLSRYCFGDHSYIHLLMARKIFHTVDIGLLHM